MLLAGDIGATKTTLALFSAEAGLAPQRETRFQSTQYDGLEAIVTEYLARAGVAVERAAFGVAGPVVQGEVQATNLPWVIREASLRETMGVSEAKLLNDLEATAYGLPHLPPGDLYPLNDVPPASTTKAVIAPGTGLGEAVLCYRDGRPLALASEGGHTDFGPTSLLEIRLLRYMMGKYGHVSYEHVCSGIAIPHLYDFFRKKGLTEERPEIAKALKNATDPTPIIVEKAMAGECELCIATLNTFVSILGAEAGNLALKVLATGGVYVGGGIPPKILPKLKDGTFMAAFVNKGRFANLLAKIPVYVILNEKTALLGAAAYELEL